MIYSVLNCKNLVNTLNHAISEVHLNRIVSIKVCGFKVESDKDLKDNIIRIKFYDHEDNFINIIL